MVVPATGAVAVARGLRGGRHGALRGLPGKAVVARVPLRVQGGTGVRCGLVRTGAVRRVQRGRRDGGRADAVRTGPTGAGRRLAVLRRGTVAGPSRVVPGGDVHGQRAADGGADLVHHTGDRVGDLVRDRSEPVGGGPYGLGDRRGGSVRVLCELVAGRLALLGERLPGVRQPLGPVPVGRPGRGRCPGQGLRARTVGGVCAGAEGEAEGDEAHQEEPRQQRTPRGHGARQAHGGRRSEHSGQGGDLPIRTGTHQRADALHRCHSRRGRSSDELILA